MNPKKIRRLKTSTYVYFMALSSNGNTLTTSNSKGVKLRNTKSGKVIKKFQTNHGYISALALSPDDTLLAIEKPTDQQMKIYDISSGLNSEITIENSIEEIYFSSNGKLTLSGHRDGCLRLFDITCGTKIRQYRHSSAFKVLCVNFCPNNDYLFASGGEDGYVRIWDIRQDYPLFVLSSPYGLEVNTVAFSPDGQFLVFGDDGGRVSLIDPDDGQPIELLDTGHTDMITSVAFTPDGKYLVSGSKDGTVRFTNVPIRTKEISVLRHDREDECGLSVVLSADGQRMATSGRHIQMWDLSYGIRTKSAAKRY